jgi:hypothetical protein
VLSVDRGPGSGSRTWFLGGVLDWVGDEPPTAESIAGAPMLEVGHAHIDVITSDGGATLGEVPLNGEAPPAPEGVMSYWGAGYPRQRAERRFIARDPPPQAERRFVGSPLTDEMLQPSATGRGIVQLSEALTDDEYSRLAAWLREYPEMTLRVYSSRTIRDFEFLRFFPSLRNFAADTPFFFESAAGLRHLPESLRGLGLGAMRRPIDLRVVARFPDLKSLYLEKHQKGIEALSGLTRLEDLTLRSITLADLSLLRPMTELRSLDVKLGGTSNLALLPEVGQLRYLELWRIRGLADVSTVGSLPHLRHLFLQTLSHVTALPDFGEARALRRIELETMKGIRDLRPLGSAPALEELLLHDMPQLQPDDLEPLVGHPTLRALSVELGGAKKNAAAQALLGLPEVEYTWNWRDDGPAQ